MKIVTLHDAVELYGKTEGSLYSNACIYLKANGVYPDWYIIQNKAVYINLTILDQQVEIDRKVWKYNTDSDNGLYWIMAYMLEMTDSEIARLCASKSAKFESVTAWCSYISTTMFALPSNNKVNLKLSMGIEFFRIATRYLYDMNKSGKLCHLL